MEEKQNKSFQYTYSAREHAEIRRIRSKYAPREESKLEQLRCLDAAVTQKGTLWALVLGILGTLIFGLGMSCCLVWADKWFGWGLVSGVAGLVMISLAYPIYSYITARERERIAPEILRLSDELLK